MISKCCCQQSLKSFRMGEVKFVRQSFTSGSGNRTLAYSHASKLTLENCVTSPQGMSGIKQFVCQTHLHQTGSNIYKHSRYELTIYLIPFHRSHLLGDIEYSIELTALTVSLSISSSHQLLGSKFLPSCLPSHPFTCSVGLCCNWHTVYIV